MKSLFGLLPVNYSSSSSVLPSDVESVAISSEPRLPEPELYTTEALVPAVEPVAPSEHSVAPRQKNVQIFLSTFFTIFLAELGDKTQVTTLLMTAESHAPWIVFAGAGAALVLTSFLGVWVGCWLAKRVAPRTLETLAGAMLLLISAALLWDVIQL